METHNSMDPILVRANRRKIPVWISAGVLSGLFYASGFIAVAFLVPVQFAFAKEGKKEGLLSMLASLAVVGIGNAMRLSSLGFMQFSVLVQTFLPPLLLLCGIGALNMLAVDSWKKVIAVSVVLVAAFGFLLKGSIGTQEVQLAIASIILQLLGSAGTQLPDAAVIARDYVAPAVEVILDCYGALLFLLLAASWSVGNRLGKKGTSTDEAMQKSSILSITVPRWLLWPSILAWGLLLLVLYGHKQGALAVVAWNASLAAASWYALQGIGLISYFFESKGMHRTTGLMLVLLILLILLDRKVGLAVAILMPVLGVSEVWLQYRIRKGA
jgi:hypothetical protein